MMIPVTRDELGNGSFTSLAKYAARHWPDGTKMPLASAQNMVAESLGYLDLHNLQQAAVYRIQSDTPSLQHAQSQAAGVLVDKYQLSSQTAAEFVQRWPLSKMQFATAPAGGANCPVTRHRQWRYLLRELAPLPEFRWLNTLPVERAMIALQPVAALARALAVWRSDLLVREHLAIDIVGAAEIECMMGGRMYGLVPLFLGRPSLRLDLRLIGLEAGRQSASIPPGLPPFDATIFRQRFGDYRHATAYRRPDLTVLANPGVRDDLENWLVSDDGLLEEAARHPLLWLGYDWDDAEFDQAAMRAFGMEKPSPVDRNPFFVTGSGKLEGALFSYGMASWQSRPGVREVSSEQRDRTLRQLDRVNDFTATANLDVDHHNAATAQVRTLGEVQQIEQADGTMDRLIVLGKRYFAHPISGDIVRRADKGAAPSAMGMRVHANWLAAYPAGAEFSWIDRASWAAQVWLDTLDAHDSKYLFRDMGKDDEDEERWLGNGFDSLLNHMGLDAQATQQLRAAFVPEKRKPIRAEHKVFVQTLNQGDFVKARAMLASNPQLVEAENDESQTALFYACREDDIDLAAAFADAQGNLEHADRESWTALMEAARYNHPRIIKWLAVRGINIDSHTKLGWTSLQVALTRNGREAAVALAAAGADIDCESVAGWTARVLASELGWTDVVDAAGQFQKTNDDTFD